jgi:hypothetical protein
MKYLANFLILIALSCNSGNTESQTKNENKLIGSWKVVADQELDSTNNVVNQDTNVAGLIMYSSDGKMSAQIVWKGIRSSIMNDTIMKQDGVSSGIGLGDNTWTPEQAGKLIDSYDSYFGDYAVDWENKIVTHTMTANLRPEKEGTAYKRRFRLKGDSLFLRNADTGLRWQVALVRSDKKD